MNNLKIFNYLLNLPKATILFWKLLWAEIDRVNYRIISQSEDLFRLDGTFQQGLKPSDVLSQQVNRESSGGSDTPQTTPRKDNQITN